MWARTFVIFPGKSRDRKVRNYWIVGESARAAQGTFGALAGAINRKCCSCSAGCAPKLPAVLLPGWWQLHEHGFRMLTVPTLSRRPDSPKQR